MYRNPADTLGEDWLAANDPDHRRTNDLDHRCRLVGLLPAIERIVYPEDPSVRGGRFVEHHLEQSAERLCSVCAQPFAPRSSLHLTCGELCRAQARRLYKRDHERARRAA